MPTQVSLLQRKTFVHGENITWYSEPILAAGYQRIDLFLQVHGLNTLDSNSVALVFQGSNEPGQNAIWTPIAAGTPADPSALSATGVNKYVRNMTLYPYLRIALNITSSSGLRAAEVTINGGMFETGV